MKNTAITNSVLKDLYRNLKTVSVQLSDNFTDEDAVSIIDKRAAIISKINSYKTVRTDDGLNGSDDNEIVVIITEIVKIDKIIADKISRRMNDITGEIRGLYKKSHATAAYISHKKQY